MSMADCSNKTTALEDEKTSSCTIIAIIEIKYIKRFTCENLI